MANEIKIERRSIGEIRAADGDKFQLCGYAARFGVRSKPMMGGDMREVIQKGAFRTSLDRNDEVVALFNHDNNRVLGRRSAGTLVVDEDERGLKFCVQLDENNTEHTNLYSACKRGDICECSFAFQVEGDDGQDFTDAEEDGQRIVLRTLRKVRLLDVSAVTNPAYPSTNVYSRSADDELTARARATVARVIADDPVTYAKVALKGETNV